MGIRERVNFYYGLTVVPPNSAETVLTYSEMLNLMQAVDDRTIAFAVKNKRHTRFSSAKLM